MKKELLKRTGIALTKGAMVYLIIAGMAYVAGGFFALGVVQTVNSLEFNIKATGV